MYAIEKSLKAVAKLAVVSPLISYMEANAELDGSVVRFWSLM